MTDEQFEELIKAVEGQKHLKERRKEDNLRYEKRFESIADTLTGTVKAVDKIAASFKEHKNNDKEWKETQQGMMSAILVNQEKASKADVTLSDNQVKLWGMKIQFAKWFIATIIPIAIAITGVGTYSVASKGGKNGTFNAAVKFVELEKRIDEILDANAGDELTIDDLKKKEKRPEN